MEVSGPLHALAITSIGREPLIHWIEGQVDHRASLAAVEKRKMFCSCQEYVEMYYYKSKMYK
jgi:hypothetical protein